MRFMKAVICITCIADLTDDFAPFGITPVPERELVVSTDEIPGQAARFGKVNEVKVKRR